MPEDPCDRCKTNPVEYKALIEDDYDPSKSQVYSLCSECLVHPDITSGLIDSWTLAEWRSEE